MRVSENDIMENKVAENNTRNNAKNDANPCRDRKGADAPAPAPIPLAYFLTFSCYGTHLHGDERGSVDRRQNASGTPYVPPDSHLHRAELERMDQPSYHLDAPRAETVLAAIRSTAEYRHWNLIAAHVRSTHVHVLIQSLETPERVMTDLKAYASRALTSAGFECSDRKRWTRHGSTRYLWKVSDIEGTMQYVIELQGECMSAWQTTDMDIEAFFVQAEGGTPLTNVRGSDTDSNSHQDTSPSRQSEPRPLGSG